MSFRISQQDFDFVRRLVEQNSAIVLGDEKDYLVEARLLDLARQENMQGPEQVLQALRRNQRAVIDLVVDAMTTNETCFFRDQRPFETLAEDVLPFIIQNCRNRRRLRIWSAASSTGQEAYSLAILIKENFPQLNTWMIEILGTDLSDNALKRAREAVYSRFEVSRGLSDIYRERYFTPLDGYRWGLRGDIKQMVSFQKRNLATGWPPEEGFDLVLIRNVLIYFGEETRTSILRRVADSLNPGGALLMGAAETLTGLNLGLEARRHSNTTYYVKPDPMERLRASAAGLAP